MLNRPSHRVSIVAAVACLFAGIAAAQAKPPVRVQVADRVLHLNGAGVHEVGFFDVDVYTASLYLERRSSNAAAILTSVQAKQLRLRFERDVSRKDLMRAARKGLVRRAGTARLKRNLEALMSRLPKVRQGDELRITVLPDRSLQLTHNGRLLGRARSGELCHALLSSWLGPRPVSRPLKRRLLGAP